jgi:hypothetical protein
MHRLSRYIEMTQDNFTTYSIELVRIILPACSEIDVVAKQLYKSKKNDTMTECSAIIPKPYPELPTTEVLVPAHSITLKPWDDWSNLKSPQWWSDHNKVKHRRNDNYQKANLGNALNTVAGLLVLIRCLYQSDWDNGEGYDAPKFMYLSE